MIKLRYIFWIAIFVVFVSCSSNNKTTDTYSKTLGNTQDKILFLKKYFQLRTEVEDAEFHIVYQDNSTGILAGPSDWSYKIALKVHPDSIDKWQLDGTIPNKFFEAEDWADIITDKAIWNLDTLLERNVLICEHGYTLIEGRNIILSFNWQPFQSDIPY